MSAKKNAPVVVSDEHNEIKIYTVKGRKGCLYQLSYYRAGERLRKTYADIHEAKREARLQLGLMAGERLQARALSALEMESYTLAMQRLPKEVSLHVCTELFSEAHAILHGRSLLDAARYYMRHYDPQRPRKALLDLGLEFIESRIARGVSQKYVVSARCTMRVLVRAFSGKTLDDIEPAALDRMLEGNTRLRNRSRNTYRIILVCFGNFLKARGYLPQDKRTAFERMTLWRNEVEAVSIYNCEEMNRLLSSAHNALVPFIAIAAFAGIRTAEICRLDWSNVHLDRGFIECEAKMAKTRSRRLVPISANLRAWLEPLARRCGNVVEYRNADQAMRRFHQSIGFKWKRTPRSSTFRDAGNVIHTCGTWRQTSSSMASSANSRGFTSRSIHASMPAWRTSRSRRSMKSCSIVAEIEASPGSARTCCPAEVTKACPREKSANWRPTGSRHGIRRRRLRRHSGRKAFPITCCGTWRTSSIPCWTGAACCGVSWCARRSTSPSLIAV